MAIPVYNFIVFLQVYFPGELSLQRVLYAVAVFTSLYPLFRLHRNQRREPRQPPATGWLRSIRLLMDRAFHPENRDPQIWFDEGPGPEYAQQICDDLEQLYDFIGIGPSINKTFFPAPRPVLVTSRDTCMFCPSADGIHSLRRRRQPQTVRLLNSDFNWVEADLFVAYCQSCNAEYLPDRVTSLASTEKKARLQRLEYDAEYIRVSKHGVWVHRRIALAQENAVLNFRCGWSNFAQWLSETIGKKPDITTRQSQRLYLEHFSRRLLVAHGLTDTFLLPSNSSSEVLARTVREHIGINGGIVADTMTHGCSDCTHLKRYKADLLATGANLDDRADGVAHDPTGDAAATEDTSNAHSGETTIPFQLPQEAPPVDGRRGYARLASMDGKTITHKICAVTVCQGELVNYKNGRFCEGHLNLREVCGIVPCGRPIHTPGALTCNDQAHKDWYSQYLNRFSRQSFPGVQRVIRKQTAAQGRFGAGGGESDATDGPQLHPTLPPLNGTPGAEVTHTFRARKTYCLQTIQWACGCPIGWGKCYISESSSQVLAFINRTWENNPESKPSFIAYDDACNLLRHIVTQNLDDPWLKTTKFIVDSWHYIGHRATDVLCRLWCNPAPTNGSQPDLVTVEVDDNGRTHTTRAFNTETAEQLNAWISGFEAQLQQMSAVNFDFCVHVIMLLYKEKVERQVVEKRKGLTEEFWDAVEGITADD
ncbi:hypothetical protein B0H16DRAFT_1883387 [Mycena metata]|uniref:CxC5 like cysteine cluster associated with KDZ domain-containing protein n=1 Tax=Mycena metata TaxID=1033252 RepID=A0AAD7ITM3_9AGAR|nr:hypothetical protein B0H16DRAFT_1888209 [Mycena metata]KAJ7764767.1 hypothetical protein B0H16DRAFT_1883387 [Mycena metata]